MKAKSIIPSSLARITKTVPSQKNVAGRNHLRHSRRSLPELSQQNSSSKQNTITNQTKTVFDGQIPFDGKPDRSICLHNVVNKQSEFACRACLGIEQA
ncbi:hypothetical protein AVEN_136965-1 [Araneus ventricosus]|uniref:Uncharacterized protein n=1 Tax=Araneus ventricosus TaxID=182803 RepID=A0A4Y2BJS6_ARAVE|nr:hypothetical protein AVEN_136965-1 [Araneus ventricosus]